MVKEVLYETNEFQTAITKEFKASMDEEAYMELMEFIETVPFVNELVSPNRRRVVDLEWNEAHTRKIIEIDKPHIIEDMEYFIQPRLSFEKNNYYYAAEEDSDPRSPYRKYWDEQMRRSIDGYERPDGEWISGYNYYYWNFGQILDTKKVKGAKTSKKGKTRSSRGSEFPSLWEIDYFYYHYLEQAEEAGLYAALLKCRGMGASFKSANMVLRNYFMIAESKSFIMASSESYLFGDGIMDKVTSQEAHAQIHTAYTKDKLISKVGHIKSGDKDKSVGDAHVGFLSEVEAVNTKDPQKSRGKRGKLIIHEEAGSNKHLIKSWGICDKSLDNKGEVFGLQLAMGTGGDEESDFLGLTNLFFKPIGYDVYSIPNVFDKNSANTVSGFFMGEYMNYKGMYNSDGVSDVVQSLARIFKNRVIMQNSLQDADAISQKKAEGALTPLEAIISMEFSLFPRELLRMCIAEMSANLINVTKHHLHGRAVRTGDKASFQPAFDQKPIIEFPYQGNQAHKAAVTVKSLPETYQNGIIPFGRYIMGVDPLEDDGEGKSLFAFQVMDLWKDDIVCWYIGRRPMVEDEWEQVLAIAVMYNAQINYESNLKGLYGYFKNHNALRYLVDTPNILQDKGYAGKRQYIGNKLKGTRATQKDNEYGRQLQATWQRKPHTFFEGKRGAETIEDIEYMRECALWEPMGNYDKVSCGNMLFILREERVQMTEQTKFHEEETVADYTDDPFLMETSNSLSLPFNSNDFNF